MQNQTSKDFSPLFSIVIPAYNCAQYIQQTLRSIYNQAEQNYEIIIINDGSTDNLLELLAQETDPRLRVITQENGGVSRARNRGLEEAQGTYIAFLDSDDVWLPFHLEKAKTFFEKYPKFHWFATHIIHAKHIDDTDFINTPPPHGSYYKSNWFLEFAPLPLASSCVVKKHYADLYLTFPEGIKMFEDNVAWSRFAIQVGAIGSYEHPTCIYRRRDDSATETYQRLWTNNTGKIGLDALLLQQKMLQDPLCPPEAKLFFQMRSLSNWGNNLSSTRIRDRKEEIKQRRLITGNFLTCCLLLYVHSVNLIIRIVQKLISLRYNQLDKKLKKMLKKERKVLN